jgi:LysW-gamma-L-lysine carboxypeptidase
LGLFLSRTSKVVSVRTTDGGGLDKVEAVVDLRLPPGLSTQAARAELPPLAEGDTMEVLAEVEPYLAERTDPVVQALAGGIRAVGGHPTYFKKGGTSDLNIAAPAWGIGGAAYGPGDGHLDHTDFESLDVEELERASRVLRHAFERLAAVGRPTTPRPVGSGAV